ncbi:MAG: acyl-ACP--UDP-N-acetylglucosamine O-acyltransferase [Pseudomonadota bacterium]
MAQAARIHRTAIVEDGAEIGDGCSIGPYCVIGANVRLAADVTLKSHVVVDGQTEIGAGTAVWPFASLGQQPQDLKYQGEPTRLVIGARNTIREQVTMNTGTALGGGVTRIGDGGLFMVGAHIAHDCTLGDGVILANNATLAGHVTLGDHVILGGLSAVHQFCRIGTGAMIGGVSGVEKDVIPFGMAFGDRATLQGLNLVGLKRRGTSRDAIHELRAAYREIFASDGQLVERARKAQAAYPDNALVGMVAAFILSDSARSFCSPGV